MKNIKVGDVIECAGAIWKVTKLEKGENRDGSTRNKILGKAIDGIIHWSWRGVTNLYITNTDSGSWSFVKQKSTRSHFPNWW